ncbi:AzlD domain-containing protein [Mumia quercus]|uniref:AzlD domain-containing protein n=1 Tax=Mumia quercus TaxID=2976125 RepID=UPI0021D37378|nr:AzlD domain-containing protein [Mumia quercus]
MSAAGFVVGLTVLALGTYALRFGGVAAGGRMPMTDDVRGLVDRAVAVLLVAVALTGALFDGSSPADAARPAGVAAGVAAAVLRAPLVVVVVVAAVTTAALRAA